MLPQTIRVRIKNGWSDEDAVMKPVGTNTTISAERLELLRAGIRENKSLQEAAAAAEIRTDYARDILMGRARKRG